MCGLIGYIGKPVNEQVETVLRDLFLETSGRGKDGWGYMAYYPRKGAKVYKDSVEVTQKQLDEHFDPQAATVLLGHTRAATSGTRTAFDGHPLVVNNIVVAHNGVIQNYQDARERLEVPSGAPTVDSYLIPHLLAQKPTILEGIEHVFKSVAGSLTFLVFTPKSPMTIWAATNVANNLYHFRMGGRDYLASTRDIFRDAVAKPTMTGLSYPAFKESWGMKGVYEISPFTIKQIVNDKVMDEWEKEGRKQTYPNTTYYTSMKGSWPRFFPCPVCQTQITSMARGGWCSKCSTWREIPADVADPKVIRLDMRSTNSNLNDADIKDISTGLNQTGTNQMTMERVAALSAKLGDVNPQLIPVYKTAIRAALRTPGVGKKRRKKLMHNYQKLIIMEKGFGADHEYVMKPDSAPATSCEVCPEDKKRNAILIYQDVDMCWECFQSFLVH